MKHTLTFTSLFLLCGCMSYWDMQGHDPKNYYAEHPIRNSLKTNDLSYTAHFKAGANQLSANEVAELREALHDISPPAADKITIRLSAADMHNELRKAYLARILRGMGYTKAVHFQPSAELARDDAEIAMAYVTVVSPDCPDWRTSPVTTYSNTHQGNFTCAQETNLGLMVEDPHDLVKGTGDVPLDSERNARVLEDYSGNKGMDLSPPWSASTGGASSSGGASTSNPTASSAVSSATTASGGGQ